MPTNPPVYGPPPPPPPSANPWQGPTRPNAPANGNAYDYMWNPNASGPNTPGSNPPPFNPMPPIGWPGNLPFQGQGGWNGGNPAQAPMTQPAAGGGGGGYAPPAVPEGSGGNRWDPTRGPQGEWVDAWGNTISHMNYGYNDKGERETAETLYGAGPPGAAPTVPGMPGLPGGIPSPAPQFSPTFYSPNTGSNWLTLPQNWLGYLDPNSRLQLDESLQRGGFNPAGQVGQYGEGVYARPASFNSKDLENLTADPALRQWLAFFSGMLGYGTSYTMPTPWGGPGLPPAPPNPQMAQPPGVVSAPSPGFSRPY